MQNIIIKCAIKDQWHVSNKRLQENSKLKTIEEFIHSTAGKLYEAENLLVRGLGNCQLLEIIEAQNYPAAPPSR